MFFRVTGVRRLYESTDKTLEKCDVGETLMFLMLNRILWVTLTLSSLFSIRQVFFCKLLLSDLQRVAPPLILCAANFLSHFKI